MTESRNSEAALRYSERESFFLAIAQVASPAILRVVAFSPAASTSLSKSKHPTALPLASIFSAFSHVLVISSVAIDTSEYGLSFEFHYRNFVPFHYEFQATYSKSVCQPLPLRAGEHGSRRINPMENIVNDFTINIATANGTGSQSANLILLQSLFDMGVPVSGKNLFPSNISGLPTWYIIRLFDHGYQAPGNRTDV